MRYSAPLDGIRATSILGVLFFHIAPNALSGGFSGVDVFFVLSGFLITSIILHDIGTGEFSLREFYLRRIQRLMPNVVVTVLGVVVLWSLLLPPSTARQTATHGLWALFSLSNVFIWKNLGGYWGNAAELAPLTHTWSLGVEEQFYLLFPVTLLLLTRAGRVSRWLGVLTALSAAFCIYQTQSSPSAAFYLLPSRVWELLVGATLAAGAITLPTQRLREVSGWAGLAIVIGGFIWLNESHAFPGVAAWLPVGGAVLLLLAISHDDTRVSWLLSRRPMVAIGALSYSLYLWHWPLITLGKLLSELYGYPRLAGAIAGGAVGVLLSIAAYVLVEQPLRRRGSGRAWRLGLTAVGFGSVAALTVVVSSRPLVADPQHRFTATEFHGKLFDSGKVAGVNLAAIVRYYDVTFPPIPPRPDDVWQTGGIIHPYGGGTPRVVVMGSSHALMYSRVIDDICRDLGVSVAFLGTDQRSAFFESAPGATPDAVREATAFNDARRRWLQTWRPDAVFVIDRWDFRMPSADDFERRLRAFVDEVSPLAGRVLWLAQPPVLTGGDDINFREFVNWRMGGGHDVPAIMPNWAEPMRRESLEIAGRVAATSPTLRVVRTDAPFYRADGSVQYIDGRDFLYADDDHLSDAGSNKVRAILTNAIADARRR